MLHWEIKSKPILSGIFPQRCPFNRQLFLIKSLKPVNCTFWPNNRHFSPTLMKQCATPVRLETATRLRRSPLQAVTRIEGKLIKKLNGISSFCARCNCLDIQSWLRLRSFCFIGYCSDSTHLSINDLTVIRRHALYKNVRPSLRIDLHTHSSVVLRARNGHY
ncbi:Uncharacterised protein [Lelliottia amnigena]|nr:Uncharacterised protein [Lelliottia amnigena]